MDPCELRLAKGDLAVRDLVARREPLVDFALRSDARRATTWTPSRAGWRRCARTAPLVAKIKDRALRPEYARKLAGDLGMEVEPVQRAVGRRRAARRPRRRAPRPPAARRRQPAARWSSARR